MENDSNNNSQPFQQPMQQQTIPVAPPQSTQIPLPQQTQPVKHSLLQGVKQYLLQWFFGPVTPLGYIKRIIYAIIGTICLFGIWNVMSSALFPQSNQSANVALSATPAPVTWKTFMNKRFNYSVKYPDNLELSQQTPYSTVFQIKNRTQLVFPTLYVSVIPDGYTNKSDIYNFMGETVINNFFIMQDNAVQQTEADAGSDAQYFTFKRLASIQVAGTPGVMIENDNVWQAQNGERNRRVLVKKNNATYIIGSYYTNQQDLNDFHDFLTSFKFL